MNTDIRPIGVELYFLPVTTRVPLKFGPETLTSVICARVRMTVADQSGRTAHGWGETPLSVQWVWPSSLSYQYRCDALQDFCRTLAKAWPDFKAFGHPLEVGHDFAEQVLPGLLKQHNDACMPEQAMPWLAALVCCSAFDIALHDAYGQFHIIDIYKTYNKDFLNRDLAAFVSPAEDRNISFAGQYPADFLNLTPPATLPAWHLVGGMDLLDDSQRTGAEPDDGYPVTLPEWIHRDGLFCLKVKLRGNDAAWDYDRLVGIGAIALAHDVLWLTADFNCTVTDPAYVNDILDRLKLDAPRIYQMILYVEQPFPYDLERNRIAVHSVSARKPLFMDESAHDWKIVRLGRSLGWTGVALKTCKTQSGALLSLCWAKAHGMTLMVQDLTNPMLAQIPHVRLAAHADTIMGVETNAMQFYPAASSAEEAVHPGLYRRRRGSVDLSSIAGAGFGYRVDEIRRSLPPAEK
jgi:L-alanine-DL-glutamate epimerase-like enolase superfamily enzyme